MTRTQFRFVLFAVVLLTIGVSYLYALAGYPPALWWWRDVFGVIPAGGP